MTTEDSNSFIGCLWDYPGLADQTWCATTIRCPGCNGILIKAHPNSVHLFYSHATAHGITGIRCDSCDLLMVPRMSGLWFEHGKDFPLAHHVMRICNYYDKTEVTHDRL